MECGQGMLLEQIEIRKSIQNTKKDVKNPHIVLFWILIICAKIKPCKLEKEYFFLLLIVIKLSLFCLVTPSDGVMNISFKWSFLVDIIGSFLRRKVGKTDLTIRSSVWRVRVWCMLWRCQALVQTELWAHRRILQAKWRILSSLIPSPLLKCQTPDILFQVHSSQCSRSSTVIL